MNTIKNSTTIHLWLNQIDSVGSCNTLNDLYKKVCIPNMITEKNESKILTKDVSCECKCKFDERKCNSNQKWNNDEC